MTESVTANGLSAEVFLKYPVALLVGFLVTFLFTPMLRRAGGAFGMVDLPDRRRLHVRATPRSGGIAVFLGFHAACATVFLFPWLPFAGELNPLWWWRFLLLSGLLLAVGIADDVAGLKPLVKLAGQTAVAVLAYAADMRMGKVLGIGLPAALDLAATVLWFLAIINAFNLIDGMDGLASGLAVIAALGLAGSSLFRHLPGDTLVLIGLAGACLAFLWYNFYPASIFLGDSGSMFLGFALAAVALSSAAKGAAVTAIVVPLLALGVPIFDTGLAVWRRSVRGFLHREEGADGGHLFQADMDHLHHRLLRSGLSQRRAATLIYGLGTALVAVGLLSMFYHSHAHGIYLLAFVAATYVVVRHLARVELWDSGLAIVKGLARPRSRVVSVIAYPLLDAALLAAALAVAAFLTAPPMSAEHFKAHWFHQVPIWVGIPFVALFLSRAYSRVWGRARISEFVLLAAGLAAGILVASGLAVLLSPPAGLDAELTVVNLDEPANLTLVLGTRARGPLLQSAVYTGFALALLVGLRAVPRVVQDAMTWARLGSGRGRANARTMLVYGAGSAAMQFLRQHVAEQLERGCPVMVAGLVERDRNLHGRRVHGYPVLGGLDDLPRLLAEHEVDEVVVAGHLNDEEQDRLLDAARAARAGVLQWRKVTEILLTADEAGAAVP